MRTITKILPVLFLCLLATLLGGCTQNNGRIGPNFGLWKLEELTIDGAPDPAYADNVVWKFHSSILAMTRVMDHHERFECYGTWSESDDGRWLLLDFSYHDDGGTNRYVPLGETHLPAGGSVLEILSRSRGEMRLRYTSPDGTVYEYRLEKW